MLSEVFVLKVSTSLKTICSSLASKLFFGMFFYISRIILMLICLDSLCHNFCNKRNFKYSSSINYWLVDIILSRSRPVGNVREIAKVELGIFTARSRNLEFISWQIDLDQRWTSFWNTGSAWFTLFDKSNLLQIF